MSGTSYDRWSYEQAARAGAGSNDTPLNKLQHKYWVTKSKVVIIYVSLWNDIAITDIDEIRLSGSWARRRMSMWWPRTPTSTQSWSFSGQLMKQLGTFSSSSSSTMTGCAVSQI